MGRFLDFLGLEIDPAARQRLIALPRPPESLGRYRGQDRSGFAAEDLDAVRELGFEIEILSPGWRSA
jgi:hypothetical protein